MPENSETAFQEVVRVLEEAVRAGVNSIGLEYDSFGESAYNFTLNERKKKTRR